MSDLALTPAPYAPGFRAVGSLARLLRIETAVIVGAVVLPIPAFALTGASIPLPATIERIAASLVPWAPGSVGGAGSAAGAPSPALGIRLTPSEIIEAKAAASAPRGVVAVTTTVRRSEHAVRKIAPMASGSVSPSVVRVAGPGTIQPRRVVVKPAVARIAPGGAPATRDASKTVGSVAASPGRAGLGIGSEISTASEPAGTANYTQRAASDLTTTVTDADAPQTGADPSSTGARVAPVDTAATVTPVKATTTAVAVTVAVATGTAPAKAVSDGRAYVNVDPVAGASPPSAAVNIGTVASVNTSGDAGEQPSAGITIASESGVPAIPDTVVSVTVPTQLPAIDPAPILSPDIALGSGSKSLIETTSRLLK